MKRLASLLVIAGLLFVATPAHAIDNLNGSYSFRFDNGSPRIGVLTFDGAGNVEGFVVWAFPNQSVLPFYESVVGTYTAAGSFGVIDLKVGSNGGLAVRANAAPLAFSFVYIPTAGDSQLELFTGHGLPKMVGVATRQ